jgi:hypothetical protein
MRVMYRIQIRTPEGVAMRISALSLIAAVALFIGVGVAPAAASHTGKAKTLNVVMHDPGCHWFSIGGKFKTAASVTGPIRLANFDEATLEIRSGQGTQRIKVGNSILLGHGHYRITMVGQAPDDNHLKLTVR